MCEALRMLMWDEIQDEVQKGIQQGRREGRREGIQEGRREERQEGREEGRMEQARETACELHDMGLPAERIAQAVRVSLETVEEWLSRPVVLRECAEKSE